MTVPLQDYDDRLHTMLREAVPGSRGVSDWTVGSTNVDWWSVRTPTEFDVISTNGYSSRTWRIVYEVFYAVSDMNAGDQGPVRKRLNILLPQIQTYFLVHANMITDVAGQTEYILGFIPSSFRAKYLGERVVNKKRGMFFNLTFNHKEQIKIKEQ
jgi:hypothetical protein